MPFGSVQLVPGINVERTPTLLQAGYSQSNLGRFKDGLFQKLGGWVKFFSSAISGVPRALHAWQDLNINDRLAVGTTNLLGVITDGALIDITPQTLTSDFSPDFSTTINTPTVEITDTNIANVTTLDAIYFNTPISVDGIILSGTYPINSITGTTSYTIIADTNAVAGVSSEGAVPQFDTTSGSSSVLVTFPAHGQSVGSIVVFPIATTGGGVTISGSYTVLTVGSVDEFTISVDVEASSTDTFDMNGGDTELVYYINLGPSAAGTGFGLGDFGAGGFGTGVVPSAQTGTPITTTDWTHDNWGEIILSCPKNGGVYFWRPSSGFANASFVATAPTFNGGLFIAMPEQILVCWGASLDQGLGEQQDPLLVRWSDGEDFTDFTPTVINQAGSQRISTGSKIVGGLQGPQAALIWTDIDLWAMSYLGPPLVFGFNKVSGGSGLASAHSACQLNGSVYWMGRSNFYIYGPSGAAPIPCTVWDAVFQNIDTDNLDKCWAWVNTPFNEIWFYYPSLTSNGQCDSYAKVNVVDGTWDNGTLSRSCGIAQSVLGPPIAASPTSIIYQHETTNDADGQPINASMTTGYFVIGDGEDVSFVDWLIPDFKWGLYNGTQGANIMISLNVVNYPGDTPVTYGPYTVTSTSQYITPRIRGRQMSIQVQSNDVGSFWRLGNIRYRYAPDGRL
jgi:hypothetical protein